MVEAREGVMAAEAMRGNNMNRAQLQAQLLNQGFQQAQAARAARLTSTTRSWYNINQSNGCRLTRI